MTKDTDIVAEMQKAVQRVEQAMSIVEDTEEGFEGKGKEHIAEATRGLEIAHSELQAIEENVRFWDEWLHGDRGGE